MSPNRKRGDKSSFPTTIVMMVMGSINKPKPKRLSQKAPTP